MVNNPSAGLYPLFGICLMFENCLTLKRLLMTTQMDFCLGIRPASFQKNNKKSFSFLIKSPIKRTKINDCCFLVTHGISYKHSLQHRKAFIGVMGNPEDLVLYIVPLVRSLHRLIVCGAMTSDAVQPVLGKGL